MRPQGLDELFNQRAEQRDPFSKARERSQEQQGREALEPGVNVFEPQGMDLSALKGPRQTLTRMLRAEDPVAKEKTKRSQVPGQLQKIGLGELSEGLSLNPMGRVQLILRLQERFGERFMDNPSAQQAIEIFDRSVKGNEQDKEDAEKAISRSNRSLNTLLALDRRPNANR